MKATNVLLSLRVRLNLINEHGEEFAQEDEVLVEKPPSANLPTTNPTLSAMGSN
jgi:hypothetical protein